MSSNAAGLIGQTLGGYRVISQVAAGGMATVYRAYQPSLDRYVALKILPAFYAQQDETFLKRFKQEARAIARLRHPNILVVLDFGEQEGITYIVMEYVEAGTLKDRLGEPMDLAEMAKIVGQVASALDYAHDQGIIHRDIKPSNILLPKPDWPLLTDFGLARMVGGSLLTRSGMTVGTPAYMSPEQGRGDRVNTCTDIYSLGAVVYEMATGVVPYTAETPVAVIVKHIVDPLPLPRSKNPNLPESVERIILKALAKDPADRYQRAGEMAEALEAAPAQEAVARAVPEGEPAAVSPAKTFGERLRSVKWPVAAAVGAVVLIAVLATAWLFSGIAPGTPTAPLPVEPEMTRTFEQHLADGRAYLDTGEYEAAVAEFEAALAQQPENTEAYWEIARAYVGAGQSEAALDTIERALEASPEETWVHQSAGWAYHEMGHYQEAIVQFERALELDPTSADAYRGLADSYRALGQPEQAVSSLEAGLSLVGEKDPGLYENIGWQYLDLGAYEEAEEAFEQAVALEPASMGAWDGLAEVQRQRGKVEAAVEVMERAIEANPDQPHLYESLGWWYREIDDREAARVAFEKAIEIDPTYSSAYSSLAQLYREAGQEEQALALLQEALEANPDQPEFYETVGRFHLDGGDAREAIPYFERAVELDSPNGWVYINLAQAYRMTGRVDKAPALLEEAARRNPDDPHLLNSVGWTYLELGDCDQAIKYFNEALERQPDMEDARQGLKNCGG